MRIVMIGAGYVGLVSGACLADFGNEVVCVEVDANKVASLREGRVPIYEPGLSELVLTNQSAGRLSFTTSLKAAGRGAQAIFITVGTPSLAEVGSPTCDTCTTPLAKSPRSSTTSPSSSSSRPFRSVPAMRSTASSPSARLVVRLR